LHENNSYGRGLVETVVTDTIGTGPRLQVAQFQQSINQQIEEAWQRWSCAVAFTDKLCTIRTAKLVDGEHVIRFISNLNLDDPVMLDLQLIEADQLRSPAFELQVSETYVDGVHLDRFGIPYAYDILKHHPGASYWTSADMWAYDTYAYEQIIHGFKQIRPGQHRGVPEFAPALPLFAFLRRFTLATVSAAETAASVSQVVETDAPIPEELESEYAAASFEKYLDSIPIDRNSATVLPNMWKLKQFAAEHPTTTYKMFKRELISEIARCLCVPANVATADSGESNFSSAKFDWLGYERTIKKEQRYLGRTVADRVFAEWLVEAALVGAIPARAANWVLREVDNWGKRGLANRLKHDWYWDGMRDADAKDAADAQRVNLQNGTTHRARIYREQGLDIEVEDDIAAATFGMTKEEYREVVVSSIFTNGNLLLQEQQQEETPSESEEGDDEQEETPEEAASEAEAEPAGA
jgi:capsid protein